MLLFAGRVVNYGIFLKKAGSLNTVNTVAASYRIHRFFKLFLFQQLRIIKKAYLGTASINYLSCPYAHETKGSHIPAFSQ